MVAGSGKIGGTVVGKGRSGSFARVRVKPTNPRTIKQAARKSAFSVRSQAWRSLTAAQQLAWNAAADSGAFAMKNPLGISFNPTGAQLYNQLNLNIMLMDGTPITSPPVKSNLSPIEKQGEGFLIYKDGDWIVQVRISPPLEANERLQILSTACISPGISRPSLNQFRQIKFGTHTISENIYPQFSAIFGEPIIGQKSFMICFVADINTGLKRIVYRASTIVEEI